MKRRDTFALAAALALPAQALLAQPAARKVLRIAFPVAETSFDPAQISDLYSRTITPHIFEALYKYDHLARPIKLKPLTAVGMPEVSADFRTWTVRIQPGIFFADDPAFKGVRRELTAQDYVFALKRFADPTVKAALWSSVESVGYVGLAALRKESLDKKTPFEYEREIEGVRALDRYTIQYVLAKPRPRFLENLSASDLFGAVAREVVQHYGDKIGEHPVGTGPFVLAQWRRSSLIVLERNPSYREVLWDAEPAASDTAGQAMLAKLKGRRLPLVDRVEVSVIEESQPRWLTFLNGKIDVTAVPGDFINIAMPKGQVAPNLAKKGIRGVKVLQPDTGLTYFNMLDPVVGGLEPERVALRRAINLGVDIDREIRLLRRGMAIPAQSAVVPHTSGYDPAFKSEMSVYDPARAKALLDMHGYVDRDGDGWREQPGGQPLLLEYATQPDQVSRQFNELWKRNMDALGLRVEFKTAKWPENLKAARAGKLMMWNVGSTAASSDGVESLARLYGPQGGQQNLARFSLPAFDAIYEQMLVLPDGPEREALFAQAKRIAVAYAPYKVHVHRFVADMIQPWIDGYRRPLFWLEWWHMVDVDAERRAAAR